MNYQRTIDELRQFASLFWPEDISSDEAELSVLPLLVQTQDAFLAMLGVPVEGLDKFFELINTADMSANLFVKHLAILADVGGEMFKRISSEFATLFPSRSLAYTWYAATSASEAAYSFRALPNRRLSNESLSLTGRRLVLKEKLTDLHKDAIAILLFGSSDNNPVTATTLANCQIGDYLGGRNDLKEFVRQRYI